MPPTQTESELYTTLLSEQAQMADVRVPIVTVSATYRKELLKKYRVFSSLAAEVVYSRAHYSMAEAVRRAAVKRRLTSHVVDPMNFVATNDWSKLDFTQFVGKLIARNKTLRWVKGKIDSKVRNKLPITDAITPILQKAVATTKHLIVSLHYEAGNIVSRTGKPILQVVTDPHVRPQYLDPLPPKTSLSNNIFYPLVTFAVFDLETKKELIKLADRLGKHIRSKNVIVTGPPVDLRISKVAKNKQIYDNSRPLNIGITTGGLGTNLAEIKVVLQTISRLITTYPEQIRLFLYAGTHTDFRDYYEQYAQEHNIRIGNLDDKEARIRILYEDSIIDANENLIRYMFPWADVIITKPSGDMAYEAIAAGCVPLFLEPWGEWEDNVKNRLIKKGVGIDINKHKADKQLTHLIQTRKLQKIQRHIKRLPKKYRYGADNIITLYQQLNKNLYL